MSIELLQGYTERIKRYNCDIKNFYIDIAMNLSDIQDFNFLYDTEYKSIKDYALSEFGYESSKTYELINIYKKFFYEERKNKQGILTYGKYSISQLKYMLNMTDEQIKQCNSNMTVKQIKELKIKKSTRVDSVDIEKSDVLKNQNVILGVFPEKKEEEKQSTLIVSQLPKTELNLAPAATETRTIVTETITSQNNNFVPNEYETYKDKYEQQGKYILKLNIEIQELKNLIKKQDERFENYECMFNFYYDELYNINNPIQNDKIDMLCCELYDFIKNHKMSKKVQFMQNVI